MKFKKLLIPMALVTTLAPVASIISCGGSVEQDEKDKKLDDSSVQGVSTKIITTYEDKMKNFQIYAMEHQTDIAPVSYKGLKDSVDQTLPWTGGIAKFALSQASSYLYNLALKLGFKETITDVKDMSEQSQTTDKLKDLKKEAYTEVKNIFDGLKILDAPTIKNITTKEYFQNVFLLEGTGNQMDERKLVSNGIDASSFGIDMQKAIQSPNGKLTDFPKFSYTASTGEDVYIVNSHVVGSQYIDANKPGTVNTVLEMAPTVDGDDNILVEAFSKKISVDNLLPTYPKAQESEKDHNLALINAAMQKLSLIFADDNSDLVSVFKKDAYGAKVTNIFIDALEFLGKNFDVSYTMKDLEKVYSELNNGSHYFKAVEVFFRGTNDINFARNTSVKNWTPTSNGSHNGLIDASIDHLEGTLLVWGERQGNGSFFFDKDDFALNYDFNTYAPKQK